MHGPQEFEIFDEEDIINSMHERKMEEKENSVQEMTEKKQDEVRKKKTKEEISIMMVNIQSLRAHLTELQFHLKRKMPHIVLIQETWLDQSHESVRIEGYAIDSRRDQV